MSEFFGDFEAWYLIGHFVAWVDLVVSLVVFVYLRPWRSRRVAVRLAARMFLAVWLIGALAAVLEGGFALMYDTTDSVNMLNTSQRWHRRHVRFNNGFESDAIVLINVLNDIEHLVPEHDAIMNAKASNDP